MAAMIDSGNMANHVTADSMAASLQQHVMAMQHHYQPTYFSHYPTMAPAFPALPPTCGASSIAAAAAIASGTLPLPSAGGSGGLASGICSMTRYPSLSSHGTSNAPPLTK